MPEVPAQYLLSEHAPAPRTLVDILHDTAANYPDAPALDDGLHHTQFFRQFRKLLATAVDHANVNAHLMQQSYLLRQRGNRPPRP